jgi:hypothetical protein
MSTPQDPMLEHRIRHRAYEIYLERQSDPALADWLQAEAEITKGTERPSGTRRSGVDRRKAHTDAKGE